MQIGGTTLHSFAGIGKGDDSKNALAREAVNNNKVSIAMHCLEVFQAAKLLSFGISGFCTQTDT